MGVTPAEQAAASTPTAPAPAPSPPAGQQATKKEAAGAANQSSSTSPPAHIVSDLPGATPPTPSTSPPTAQPAPPQAPVSASPSVNNLAFRSSQPTASQVPVVKWRVTPHKPQKVPIMDAPGPDTGAPAPLPASTSGFPSPNREKIHQLPKFKDDRTRITFGIQQALPEAVRRSVRDNWEKCLVGSDFHQAFVLNATIHHATPAAIRRGIEGFGKTMVTAARNEIVDHMSRADLDKVAGRILDKASASFLEKALDKALTSAELDLDKFAERILAKASDSFLDKALDKRFKTIDAKHLINALARAERLGYLPSDVQDDAAAAGADAPSAPSASTPRTKALPPQGVVPPSQPAATAPVGNMPPHCTMCFRRFFQDSAFVYHTKNRVCERIPQTADGFQFSCKHCGQGFTSIAGLHYHKLHQQCGNFDQPSPTQQTSPAVPTPHSAATPTAVARRSYSTPRRTPTTQTPAAPASSPANTYDPYSVLSQEQLNGMQADMDNAEAYYAERIRQASAIPDPVARRAKLDSLSNSFSTKQSLIRKKYGIRLRMRRSKEEVQAERHRMFYRTPTELQAEMGLLDPGVKPKSSGRKPKFPRTSTVGQGSGFSSPLSTPAPATTTLASSLAVPQAKTDPSDSNDVSMGNRKRSYTGDGESPSAKRIAYAEMGGLGGDVTMEAETLDPTTQPAAGLSKTQMEQRGAGTAAEPMMLDNSGTASGADDDDDDDDDDSSDDDDDDDEDGIPARLPASVLQSLHRSSSAAAASPRPGSS